MSRRRRQSTAEDLMDLVALLPWWAGVTLAVVAWLALHAVASQPVAVPTAPGHAASPALQWLWKALATGGQFVLPLICLFGAAMSAIARRQRAQLVATVTANPAAEVLNAMSWREFEMLVGEAFRREGFRVAETGGGGADGGVDLVLTRPGTDGSETVLVQCKQRRASTVPVMVVRELLGVMTARGAAGGIVVTSGRYTAEAVAFATGRNIRLIDGPQLHRLIRGVQPAAARPEPQPPQQPQALQPLQPQPQPPAKPRADAAPVASPSAPEWRQSPERPESPVPHEPPDPPVPACPRCARPMALRRAQRGAHAGSAFWGCTGFPRCRGTRPLA